MKDIADVRQQLDNIDDQIIDLYMQRMALSKDVAEIKKASGKGISDSERENKIVYRLAQKVPADMKLYVKELYSAVFCTSKAYQSKLIGQSSKTLADLAQFEGEGQLPWPAEATVACQGVKGANSGVAAQKLFAVSDVTYFRDFDGVFSAVERGLCEYGVLPIENSTAGSVSEVYDLMKKHNFYVVRSVRVRVDHCLCALPGTNVADIKKVYSHPQALSQCAEFLKKNGFVPCTADNTAVAGKMVAESGDRTIAALCTAECAEAYGLKIIKKSVQDNLANFTRFICISKDLKVFKGADRISVMTSLSHKPGSLNMILSRFSALGLNLTKIESRPIAGAEFEFMFYFDFEGDTRDADVKNVIAELENGSENFVFLGNYKEVL